MARTFHSPAFFPVIFSVSLTISSLILWKSWNFCPGRCKNSPHSSALSSLTFVFAMAFAIKSSAASFYTCCARLTRLVFGIAIRFRSGHAVDQLEDLGTSAGYHMTSTRLTSGRRVTIPVPRGKKSRPTMFFPYSQVHVWSSVRLVTYLEDR